MSDKPPDWSLKKEMQKRKTQEIIRDVEAKRASQEAARAVQAGAPTGPTSKTSTGEVKRASQNMPAAGTGDVKRTTGNIPAVGTGGVRRTTQSAPAARSTGEAKRLSQSMPAVPTGAGKRTTQSIAAARSTGEARRVSQTVQSVGEAARRTIETAVPMPTADEMAGLMRRRLLPALLVILVLAVFGLVGGMATGSFKPKPTSYPTAVNLPVVTAQDAVDYLKRFSVPVVNITSYPVPNKTWHAHQELQFDVVRADGKATIILLSYASANWSSLDAFLIKNDPKFKTWQASKISNLLVVVSPDSAESVRKDVLNHLTHYLVAPYIKFISTATPTPGPTATNGPSPTATAKP